MSTIPSQPTPQRPKPSTSASPREPRPVTPDITPDISPDISPAAPPHPGRPLVTVRRPPAPRSPWGSVTRLVPPGAADDGDGDGDVPFASIQGTLALDLGRAPVPATGPGAGLHVVDDPGATPAAADAAAHEAVWAVPDDAEVRAWAGRFAQAVVEVLGGDRPVSQLLRCTSPRVYQDLGRRVQILARTAPATQRRRTLRPQVRSVRVFQPTRTSAEVSVHVGHGKRSRALAARLEHREGRWTCTALQVG